MLETTLKKVSLYLFITMFLVALLVVMVLFKGTSVEQSISGVQIGNEYNATHLVATTSFAYLLESGRGTFGSVVINVLGTGNVVFYDATSTNSNLRTVTATTSLPVVGYIAASQAAGVYTYDTRFLKGLMAVFSGAQGTSTVITR